MQNANKSDLNIPSEILAPRELNRRRPDPAALARLLDGWMRGDPAEQSETFEILRQSLDEDRPVGYKLFP